MNSTLKSILWYGGLSAVMFSLSCEQLPLYPVNSYSYPGYTTQFDKLAPTNNILENQSLGGPLSYQQPNAIRPGSAINTQSNLDVPQQAGSIPNTPDLALSAPNFGPFSPGLPYYCNPLAYAPNIVFSIAACKPFLGQIATWLPAGPPPVVAPPPVVTPPPQPYVEAPFYGDIFPDFPHRRHAGPKFGRFDKFDDDGHRGWRGRKPHKLKKPFKDDDDDGKKDDDDDKDDD